MLFSMRGFWLSGLFFGALAGCIQKPSATAQVAAPAQPVAPGASLNERFAAWDGEGRYSELVEAARERLQTEPQDATARYYLARGLFYNADFGAAVTEIEKAMQSPSYQNDENAGQIATVARYLAGRYPNQKFEPVTWVEGDVSAQMQQWQKRGAALLAAKDYDEIERVAAQEAKKPTIFADGSWSLSSFYVGLWSGVKDTKTEADWKRAHARVVEWNAARPNSLLAQLCLARSWTSGAWSARGNNFADKVSPEAWAIVEERQAQGAPIYQKLLNAPQAFSPLVYAAAQRYGRLGGAPRDWQDRVFKRAIAQFPTYTDFHRERAIGLLPRWYGEPGEWEEELARAADAEAARAGQEAGDQLYARVMWSQWDYYKNWREETSIDWPRTQRGFEALLRQHPDSISVLSTYMLLLYGQNEGTKARELLQKIGGRADASVWRDPAHFARVRINLLRLLT